MSFPCQHHLHGPPHQPLPKPLSRAYLTPPSYVIPGSRKPGLSSFPTYTGCPRRQSGGCIVSHSNCGLSLSSLRAIPISCIDTSTMPSRIDAVESAREQKKKEYPGIYIPLHKFDSVCWHIDGCNITTRALTFLCSHSCV